MTDFTDAEIDRYARQLILHEVGGPGQQRLAAARVTVVGLGGLGGPAALYLAAAGVGHMHVVDGDVVSRSNLHRQIQFATEDCGQPKAEVLAKRLRALNPHVTVTATSVMVDADGVDAIVRGSDVVLDGTDDFAVRFAVNAACVRHGVVLVSGALGAWTAQVGLFAGHQPDMPCYQCWVPQTPPRVETCAAVGIVGALAGVAGTMMALEAIKHITGAGTPLLGRLWLWDGLNAQGRTVQVPKDPACPVCGPAH